MESKIFDVIVIGAGPGGYPAAIRAAQKGKKVALIEAKKAGGTCLHRGCIPSKALIAGAEFYTSLKKGSVFGLTISGIKFDYSQLALHKDNTVEKMSRGLEGLLSANRIQLFKGYGKFISQREVKVLGENNALLKADKIIIATGSEPKMFPQFAFDGKNIHDSTSLLALKKLPKSLLIIGGGVIGCEFASLYSSLGVEVTILELLPRILSTESIDVSQALTKIFSRNGVKVEASVQVEKVALNSSEEVEIILKDGRILKGEMSLISVGRSLNTKEIGLEKAGVAVEASGLIPVNEKMETNIEGIYAVGDIASRWWLAHVASHQGIIAAENACGGQEKMSYKAIPSVIFTHPEIASVGLSLENALKQGYKAITSAFPFQALGKSQASLNTEGFAQIVIDKETGEILGAQVVGQEASTLISEMTLAIENELTIECLEKTIHPHPTLEEAWGEAAFIAQGFPIHLPPRAR